MSIPLNQAILDMVQRLSPEQVATDILSVQPMDKAMEAFAELDELLKANPDKRLVIHKKPELP